MSNNELNAGESAELDAAIEKTKEMAERGEIVRISGAGFYKILLALRESVSQLDAANARAESLQRECDELRALMPFLVEEAAKAQREICAARPKILAHGIIVQIQNAPAPDFDTTIAAAKTRGGE